MTIPISPVEAQLQRNDIPDFVINIVNQLLKDNYKSDRIRIYQKDVVKAIKDHTGGTCEMKWLDFEDFYRATGWGVTYDKPAYCETYDAFFIFKPSKKLEVPAATFIIKED